MLVTFGDSDSGIFSVRLLDDKGNDVSSSARIADNTVEFTLTDPADGTYRYRLVLEDWAGNITSYELNFAVDSTPPTTTVSLPGGHYDGAVGVDLTCSESAAIITPPMVIRLLWAPPIPRPPPPRSMAS